ncbi:MAG: potassium channel family protein [Candidatus Brocadiae bacterium]|nr:potassium channel family protein [Candidatus Brocadiia bacterium]
MKALWVRSDQYCIFHEPEKTTQEAAEEFETQIRKQFAACDFDCGGYEFPSVGNTSIPERDKEVFDFCKLLPDGRTIPDGADFRRTRHPLETVFSRCHFGDGVRFSEARFLDDVDFTYAKFGDDVSFSFVTFAGSANFQISSFGSRADFFAVRFEKPGSFYWASFGPEPRFELAEMKGTDLRATRVPRGRFFNCNLADVAMNADTVFHTGDYFLGDELAGARGDEWREAAKKTAYANSEDAYRRVRQLLKAKGFYHDAGEFYYRERVCRRKSFEVMPRWLLKASYGALGMIQEAVRRVRVRLRANRTRVRRLSSLALGRFGRKLRRVRRRVMNKLGSTRRRTILSWAAERLLFDWMCGYGERPVNLIKRAALFVFCYAIAYLWLFREYIQTATGGKLASVWDALYFSVATFTTLGFGDYAPRGSDFVKLLVASEAVLGALTIGLAMVTFARKAIRD